MYTSLLFSAATLLSLSSCLPYAKRQATLHQTAKVIYFLTDEDAGNSVVALKISPNGTLSDGTVTGTGGHGASVILPNYPNITVAPDSLQSTGSVLRINDMLLAVNAGSNTISMFRINPDAPWELTTIAPPIDSQGDFPNSITYSEALNMACVGNSGVRSGVSCFHICQEYGLIPASSFRSFPLNQTNPPLGLLESDTPYPASFMTSVQFTPDSKFLLAAITFAPQVNYPATLLSYPVVNGLPVQTGITSTIKGAKTPFNLEPIPGTSNYVATDALVGSLIVTVSDNGTATDTLVNAIPDQHATCWSIISPATNTIFVTDGAENRIVELNSTTNDIVSILDIKNQQLSYFDIVANGELVYALSAGLMNTSIAILTVDVSGGPGKQKEGPTFIPSGLNNNGNIPSAQGLELYV